MKRGTLIAMALVLTTAATVAARQATGVAGTWKLNVADSHNPNGPAPTAAGERRGGGNGTTASASGGRRGGGGFDATGGAAGVPNQAPSVLSPEETQRIKMMLSLLDKAAQVLDIIVDGPDVTIKQDGGGFPKQTWDGKKLTLKQPQIGEVDIKIKITNKGMTREVTTQDDLKVVENYVLSADGKQLVVTMKASQPVMKIEDAKIKRVYDRQ